MFVPPIDSPPEYLGLFASGQRIGYSKSVTTNAVYLGVAAKKSDSETRMTIALAEAPLEIAIDSTTYTVQGTTKSMRFVQKSGGRESVCVATFGAKTVVVEMTNDGATTKREVSLPDGPVVDDPVTAFLADAAVASKAFYILDPTTGSFVKNTIRRKGKARVAVGALNVDAFRIDIEDPRMTTTLYISGKGDLIKSTTPLGIDALPLTQAEALAPIDTMKRVDLATVSSIIPIGDIGDAPSLSRLRLKITGIDIASVPSGDHQAAKAIASGWLVDIKPRTSSIVKSATILQAGDSMKEYLKPDSYIPSEEPEMIALAKRIVGEETGALAAAQLIRRYVAKEMTPNAGIGILRDAREVLRTKEGVCRDYAILLATLCRAAGIPTRLATGLVTWDGTFYYHAWCEVWTGGEWIGIDSAAPDDQISAGHVKLSQGSVDRAFLFPVLGRAKIEVLAKAHSGSK